MRRARPLTITAVTLAAGLALSACDSGPTPTPSDATSPTSTTPSGSTAASGPVAERRISDGEAKAALVTTGDLPSGWDQVGTDVTRATLSERILTGTTEPATCQTLVDAAEPQDTTTLGVAAFRRSVAGPWLAETVASYDDAAASRVQQVTDAARACPEFTLVAANGDRVAVKVSAVTEGVVGADSVGFRLSGKRGIVPAVADVVLLARGNTLVGAVGGGVSALDGTAVKDAVTTSAGRLPAS